MTRNPRSFGLDQSPFLYQHINSAFDEEAVLLHTVAVVAQGQLYGIVGKTFAFLQGGHGSVHQFAHNGPSFLLLPWSCGRGGRATGASEAAPVIMLSARQSGLVKQQRHNYTAKRGISGRNRTLNAP